MSSVSVALFSNNPRWDVDLESLLSYLVLDLVLSKPQGCQWRIRNPIAGAGAGLIDTLGEAFPMHEDKVPFENEPQIRYRGPIPSLQIPYHCGAWPFCVSLPLLRDGSRAAMRLLIVDMCSQSGCPYILQPRGGSSQFVSRRMDERR